MAITLEYGKCASCGRENPKAIEQCRGCDAVLPWAKNASGGKAIQAQAAPKNKVGAGDLAWGGMAVALGGGLVFVLGIVLWCGNVFGFLPTVPLAGYITMAIGGAIWRAGSAMDS